jgi:hypothetical protein
MRLAAAARLYSTKNDITNPALTKQPTVAASGLAGFPARRRAKRRSVRKYTPLQRPSSPAILTPHLASHGYQYERTLRFPS